jgi:hypothetical protein
VVGGDERVQVQVKPVGGRVEARLDHPGVQRPPAIVVLILNGRCIAGDIWAWFVISSTNGLGSIKAWSIWVLLPSSNSDRVMAPPARVERFRQLDIQVLVVMMDLYYTSYLCSSRSNLVFWVEVRQHSPVPFRVGTKRRNSGP